MNSSSEDDRERFVAEKIIARRVSNSGRPEYKIKWKNYPESEATWEPLNKLKKYSLMVETYEHKLKKRDAGSDSDVQVMERKGASSDEEVRKKPTRAASSSSDSAPRRKQVPPPKKRKDSSSSDVKMRKRQDTSSESDRPKKKTVPKKPVSMSSSPEVKRKQVKKASSSERSRSPKRKPAPATKEATNSGKSKQQPSGPVGLEMANEIQSIRKDSVTKKIDFLVSFAAQKGGKKPEPVWATEQQLKDKAPKVLCEYLLKKVKWPSSAK